MKLAVNVGYWGGGAGTDLIFIEEAERLGYSSVWVAEAEREGDTIIAAARSESRAWARLWEQASARRRDISAFSSARASA